MDRREFKKRYGCHMIPECCATCEHSYPCGGEKWECWHPDMDDSDEAMSVEPYFVCSAWTKEKKH